jgi:hypothetical protein
LERRIKRICQQKPWSVSRNRVQKAEKPAAKVKGE